eukprot:1628887-Pyramimonas_sp.AAC.1
MTPYGSSQGTRKKRGEPGAKKVEAAKRIQQWRWLIIDGISMVYAHFFFRAGCALAVCDVGSEAREGGCR